MGLLKFLSNKKPKFDPEKPHDIYDWYKKLIIKANIIFVNKLFNDSVRPRLMTAYEIKAVIELIQITNFSIEVLDNNTIRIIDSGWKFDIDVVNWPNEHGPQLKVMDTVEKK